MGERLCPGKVGRLRGETMTPRTPGVRRKNVYQDAVGRNGEEKSKGFVLPGKARGVIGESTGEATRAMAAFPIPWSTRVLREHANNIGAIQVERTSWRGREGGRCGAGCVQMSMVWLLREIEDRQQDSMILPRHAYAPLHSFLSKDNQPGVVL
jgi:hypothetical protein